MVADVTYVGRMGLHLQRERNINQLQPGTVQANPGVNVNALRPYLGFAHHPALRERGPLDLPRPAAQPRAPLPQRPGLRRRLHALQAARQRRPTSATSCSTPTTTAATGASSDNDRTHLFNVHYLYELPFWRNAGHAAQEAPRRLAGLGRDLLPVRAGRSRSGARDDIAGRRRHDRAALEPGRAIPTVANPQFSNGRAVDQNFWFNPAAFARPAPGTFGNAGRNPDGLRGPGFQSWDIALFKNIPLGGSQAPAAPAGGLQLHQPPEPGRSRPAGNVERRPRLAGRRQRRPEQRRLRPRAHQDERAQHPAGGEVQLLTDGRSRPPSRGRVLPT